MYKFLRKNLDLFKQTAIFDYLALSICALFFVIFTAVALHRFWQYEAWNYDFGIFARAIWQVSRFQLPIIDHFTVTNKLIFADHFHPIIFLLSPLYWITDKPEVLLLAQTLAVSISGFILYLTSKIVLKENFISLCLLIMYFSFAGLQNAVITEFHEITLLPLPLSLFFFSLVKKKHGLYFVSTLLVLMVKESTFVITAFFSLMELIKSRAKWQKLNLAVFFFSIFYALAIITMVIPHIAQGKYQYASTETISIESYKKFIDSPEKAKTIWNSLLSFGFFPLFAPHLLFPVVVNWYIRFTSLATTRHGLGFHYNAETAPLLYFASLFGIVNLISFVKNKHKIQFIVFIFTIITFLYSFFILKSPLRLATIPEFYRHTQNFEFLDQLVSEVPKEGSVMAQTNLTSRLINREIYAQRQL